MQIDVQQAATYITALGFLILAALGVVSVLISGFRRFLFERVVGGIVLMATAQKREADRRVQVEQAKAEAVSRRRERLRSAVGVLQEGLAMPLNDTISSIKIAQAVGELRAEGPSQLAEFLDQITSVVGAGGPRGDHELLAHETDKLTRPIIDRLVRVLREE